MFMYHCKDLVVGKLCLYAQRLVSKLVQALNRADEFPVAIQHVSL